MLPYRGPMKTNWYCGLFSINYFRKGCGAVSLFSINYFCQKLEKQGRPQAHTLAQQSAHSPPYSRRTFLRVRPCEKIIKSSGARGVRGDRASKSTRLRREAPTTRHTVAIQYATTGRVSVSRCIRSRWSLDGLNPAGWRQRPPAGASDAGKVGLVLELAHGAERAGLALCVGGFDLVSTSLRAQVAHEGRIVVQASQP